MTPNRSVPGIVFPERDTPAARHELVEHFKQFHADFLRKSSCEDVLKAYTLAYMQWALNPNTELYQLELLFDEIYHASKAEEGNEEQPMV